MEEFGAPLGKIREELGCGKDRTEICPFRYRLLPTVTFAELPPVASLGEPVLKLTNTNITIVILKFN